MRNGHTRIGVTISFIALLAFVGCALSESTQLSVSSADTLTESSCSLPVSSTLNDTSLPESQSISYASSVASEVISTPISNSQMWHIYPVLVDEQGATKKYHWDFEVKGNDNTDESEYLSVDFALSDPWESLGRVFRREDIPMSLHLYCEAIRDDQTFEEFLEQIASTPVTIVDQGTFAFDGKTGDFYDDYYRLDGGVYEYIYRIRIEEKKALLTVRFTVVEYFPELYRPIFEEVISSITW